MYSEELMTYLYSYNMPQKKGDKETLDTKEEKNDMPLIKYILKSAYATVPVKYHNEA